MKIVSFIVASIKDWKRFFLIIEKLWKKIWINIVEQYSSMGNINDMRKLLYYSFKYLET